ncbi:ThiF family adenylyltransferase [Granulicella arctica]|uniref:Adenylyltransferase/sulfurtransferase n=1 Tax=Granulicella arctica TaxID=940613 RepID=A0A7Y9PEX5_9BACT|nr:ThiF family adenylyltransferase [Granulicella arctica]NYF78665.1 adenylyltransferase/sulfurtransferase [Granulicella arctica]
MPDFNNPVDYSRLEQTTFTRQQVAALRVAVIGCGALGAEAARLLGLLGVGSVLLIDHDRVEPTNLTHSPYLRAPNTLGRPKANVLAEALAPHFPDTAWLPLPHEIADIGFGHLQPCNLLFSCTDNALARVETTYAAHRLHLPVMDAGLKGRAFWAGRVAWFPAPNESSTTAACYLCQLTAARRAELLSLALSASQSCSAPAPDPTTLPSTPTMASIVAALQVDLGLRLLLTPDTPAEARAWELSLTLPQTTWTSFTIPRSADCPWHEPNPSADLAPLLNMDTVSIKESLETETLGTLPPPRILELDWPICLQARCTTCQHRWSPIARVATLRRRLTCPHCGATGSHLHSIETLTTITPSDPAALLTPNQLNLPPNHLFTLRRQQKPSS